MMAHRENKKFRPGHLAVSRTYHLRGKGGWHKTVPDEKCKTGP